MGRIFDEDYTISNGGSYKDHLDGTEERKRLAGVDLVVKDSQNTYGKVVRARWGGQKQNLVGSYNEKYVQIVDGNTMRLYVHLRDFEGGNGWVNEGDVIGYAGNTGWVEPKPPPFWNGTHLHYAKYVNGVNVDPTDELLINKQPMYKLETKNGVVEYDDRDKFFDAWLLDPSQVGRKYGEDVTDLLFLTKNWKDASEIKDKKIAELESTKPEPSDPQLLADGEKYRILKSSLKEIMK